MVNSYKKNIKGVSTKIRRGNASRRNSFDDLNKKTGNKGKVKGRAMDTCFMLHTRAMDGKFKRSCYTAAANRRACLKV